MATVLSALRGEIDFATADAFRSGLYDLIDRCDLPIVHVDLRAVTFLDSAGYHALVEATEYGSRHGHVVVLQDAVRAMRQDAPTLRPGQRTSHRAISGRESPTGG